MIDRIKQLLDWQQLSPTQFADRIGVGRPVVSHILSERNKPSLEVVQRIIAAFPDLSLPWLLSGSGGMLAAPAPPAAPTVKPDGVGALATAPPVPTSAPAGKLAAAMPATPARPAAATVEPQPAPYQRVAPGGAGPARFRAGGVPLTAAPEPGAARFVTGPARSQPVGPVVAQPAALVSPAPPPLAAGMPVPAPTAREEASVATVAPPASTPLASATPPEAAVLAQAMSESLGDPGKTIRRIVLFYTDGSFADFKPE